MPIKKYFSYIRVSTQRQGQHGTSLAEQQAAIERFARSWNLSITKRFEEQQSAARNGGRTVFLNLIRELKRGAADGVIIHKIDRSARNLKDWAELLSLSDAGVEVHFAAESLDLSSRGGRLSADIQAVVASDFIRNLREETKKGLYGRLRQGLYPFKAVNGYVDSGAGRPKEIDPASGPLIRKAFELYSSGEIGLHALADEMHRLGLRGRTGNKITINGLSTILHNPFYMGVIRIEKTGDTFRGVHRSLISRELFDRVQTVLAGKNIKKQNRHFFAYRKMIRCRACGNFLIPERKRSYVYYRCHTRTCTRTSLKERSITEAYLSKLETLTLSRKEFEFLKLEMDREVALASGRRETDRVNLKLQLDQIADRLSALADALIDGLIDKETYLRKKEKLLMDEAALRQRIAELPGEHDPMKEYLDVFLGILKSAYLSFDSAPPELQRKLAKIVTLEFAAEGKTGLIKLKPQYQMVSERSPFRSGRAHRETTRNFAAWISLLIKFQDCLAKHAEELPPDFTFNPAPTKSTNNSIPKSDQE